MKRVLTGIKPTGYAHIGNYFGMIKPAIEMSHNKDFECFAHNQKSLESYNEFKSHTLESQVNLDFKNLESINI